MIIFTVIGMVFVAGIMLAAIYLIYSNFIHPLLQAISLTRWQIACVKPTRSVSFKDFWASVCHYYSIGGWVGTRTWNNLGEWRGIGRWEVYDDNEPRMESSPKMEPKEVERLIIKMCVDSQSLQPLIKGITSGQIKFLVIPRSAQFFFGMQSIGGLIKFENDQYFYTYIEGEYLDKLKFTEEDKTELELQLSKINDKLRNI